MRTNRIPYTHLTLLTAGALLVHGYHPGIEDAEIYIPGIKKLLNPTLYPFGAEFFQNHARLTLFDDVLASSIRTSPLSFDLTIFIWYVVSTFLTLLACWLLSAECFREKEARWAGVGMVAALLTIPVAGTSLYIEDQYLTSRCIVTFAVLFAVWNAWTDRKLMWALWSIVAVCIHPLMAVFGLSYSVLLWWMKQRRPSFEAAAAACLLAPATFSFDLLPIPSQAYQQAVGTRSYFFLLKWEWYEWIGALAPLLLLWLIGKVSESRSAVRTMSRSLIVYGFFFLVAGLALTIPVRFQSAARLQPMRSLHLLYIMMFLLGGGLLGKYILQRRLWRWIGLFLPLCAGMFFVQRRLFPSTPHLELPYTQPGNDWLQGFDWIRRNTPTDAIFAMDPEYMEEDDQHGFRAIAERSRLADALKDSGAVTMFPELPSADRWLEQLSAQRGWADLKEKDFREIKNKYGVTWVVSQRRLNVLNLKCPYENRTIRVCRLD